MFVTNYYQSKAGELPYDENLIPKNSFCNTVCACMVMQLKLVVVAVDNGSMQEKERI